MMQADMEEVQNVLGYVTEVNIAADHARQGERDEQRQHSLKRLEQGDRAQTGAVRPAPLQFWRLRDCDSTHEIREGAPISPAQEMVLNPDLNYDSTPTSCRWLDWIAEMIVEHSGHAGRS